MRVRSPTPGPVATAHAPFAIALQVELHLCRFAAEKLSEALAEKVRPERALRPYPSPCMLRERRPASPDPPLSMHAPT